mmetsp:Transcript_22472/g.67305  ORF Transcript_22472/g.67305 Transcript_22472/m.67305 type:complete len:285 (-) Transcript_22472:214-1068(-)
MARGRRLLAAAFDFGVIAMLGVRRARREQEEGSWKVGCNGTPLARFAYLARAPLPDPGAHVDETQKVQLQETSCHAIAQGAERRERVHLRDVKGAQHASHQLLMRATVVAADPPSEFIGHAPAFVEFVVEARPLVQRPRVPLDEPHRIIHPLVHFVNAGVPRLSAVQGDVDVGRAAHLVGVLVVEQALEQRMEYPPLGLVQLLFRRAVQARAGSAAKGTVNDDVDPHGHRLPVVVVVLGILLIVIAERLSIFVAPLDKPALCCAARRRTTPFCEVALRVSRERW